MIGSQRLIAAVLALGCTAPLQAQTLPEAQMPTGQEPEAQAQDAQAPDAQEQGIPLPPKAFRRTPPGVDPDSLPPLPARSGNEGDYAPPPPPARLADEAQGDADASAPEQARVIPPSVLAILAHPDDEITIAPVLSRIAREGGEVTLVFVTSGDAGPGLSGVWPGAELGRRREREGRCAAFALGLKEPEFWRMGDGTLASMARAEGSAAERVLARIEQEIALRNPQVIMTWGPDGGYGHADHRMVSALVTQIVAGMGPERPDLLYAAFPRRGTDALPEFESWATTTPDLLTDSIRYQRPDLQATEAALSCYESQFPRATREALAGVLHDQVWQGTIYFRLAFARPF